MWCVLMTSAISRLFVARNVHTRADFTFLLGHRSCSKTIQGLSHSNTLGSSIWSGQVPCPVSPFSSPLVFCSDRRVLFHHMRKWVPAKKGWFRTRALLLKHPPDLNRFPVRGEGIPAAESRQNMLEDLRPKITRLLSPHLIFKYSFWFTFNLLKYYTICRSSIFLFSFLATLYLLLYNMLRFLLH